MAGEYVSTLAREIQAAYANAQIVSSLPTSREGGLDMASAYSVESELMNLRRATGHKTVGVKVGYANKAVWRILKLETLVWAHMYDDTVSFAESNNGTLSLTGKIAPKIEPEVVFKMKSPLAGSSDPVEILNAVEWIALGFEIIDCIYPNWEFQPADFVAAYGLHAALIVGEPQPVNADSISQWVDQLAKFKLRLLKNNELVEEGSGKNSLRSPALCLGELSRIAPLVAGDLVSSGTLTTPQLIQAGEQWSAEVEGIGFPRLNLQVQ